MCELSMYKQKEKYFRHKPEPNFNVNRACTCYTWLTRPNRHPYLSICLASSPLFLCACSYPSLLLFSIASHQMPNCLRSVFLFSSFFHHYLYCFLLLFLSVCLTLFMILPLYSLSLVSYILLSKSVTSKESKVPNGAWKYGCRWYEHQTRVFWVRCLVQRRIIYFNYEGTSPSKSQPFNSQGEGQYIWFHMRGIAWLAQSSPYLPRVELQCAWRSVRTLFR